MGVITLLILAMGLSMDSFAVSVTSGAIIRKFELRRVIKIACYMGIFQGAMPAVGWMIGKGAQQYVVAFDHWIAFGLLGVIGGKMIWEALKGEDDDKRCFNPSKTIVLLGLAFATSIDAIVVGVGFGLLDTTLLLPVIIITVVTFVFSFVGVGIGIKFGQKYNKSAEILGGVVLIGLGLKTLLEHTVFG